MAQQTIDFVIRAVDRASATLSKVQTQVQAMSQSATKNFANMRHKMGKFVPADMLQAQSGKVSQAINTATAQLDGFNDLQRTTQKNTTSMADSFDAAALGIMFFGMQLQRVFGGIIRSGVSTFNKVMGQLQDTTTAADRLSGTFKFLKFSIGEALMPILSFLQPITEFIARWVQDNQAITRTVLSIGTAIGGILTTVGAIQLGIKATQFAFQSGFLSPIGNALQKLGLFETQLGGLAQVIGIAFAIESATKVAQQISDGEYGKAIKNALATVLIATGVFFATGGTSAALVAAGIALRFVETETLINKFLYLGRAINSIFDTVIAEISENWVQGISNTIVRSLEHILSFLSKMPDKMKSFLGLDGVSHQLEDIRNQFANISDDVEKSALARFRQAMEENKTNLSAEKILSGEAFAGPTPANANTGSMIRDNLQEQTNVLREIRDLQRAKSIVRQERGFGSLQGMSDQEILDAANRIR